MDTHVSSAVGAQVHAHPAVSAVYVPGNWFTWPRWAWMSSRQRNYGIAPLVSPAKNVAPRKLKLLT